MQKKVFIIFLLLSIQINAQKELWGTGVGGGIINPNPNGYGGIFKTNFDATIFNDVHLFDSIAGMKPYGRLFVASNGKLYGTASEGGLNCTLFREGGVLYEYDLILDQFRVVAHLGSTIQFPTTNRPTIGVFEPQDGILYGASENGAIFKYTIATEALSISANVPNFTSGVLSIQNSVRGELMKASDGFVYGTTKHYSNNPNGAPYLGSIARLNTTNNNLSLIYPFELVFGPLYGPTGGLVEANQGQLYGTTRLGGVGAFSAADPFNLGGGTLFEYNFASNSLTKKIDFDYNTIGSGPQPLCLAADGKLYGILGGGGQGTDPWNPNQHYGSLFQYNIDSNSITIVKYFGYENNMSFGIGAKGTLTKGTDNNLYGICSLGIFRYEPSTNNFTQFYGFGLSTVAGASDGELLEICRKPSYHFFDTDAFTPCVNTPFVFDVQNTNATSYVWKRNNIILPLQTSSVLNIPNTTATDNGTYTCTMTNECGNTITMPLTINVGCLGLEGIDAYRKAITLYPNPTKDILNIGLPNNYTFRIAQCSIYNMLGQVIYQSKQNVQIDTSRFPSGLYNVVLKTDQGDWFGKFIKE